jgi:hypothetical protein
LTALPISKRHNPEGGGCGKVVYTYFGVVISELARDGALFPKDITQRLEDDERSISFFLPISRRLATGATSQCSSGDLSIWHSLLLSRWLGFEASVTIMAVSRAPHCPNTE